MPTSLHKRTLGKGAEWQQFWGILSAWQRPLLLSTIVVHSAGRLVSMDPDTGAGLTKVAEGMALAKLKAMQVTLPALAVAAVLVPVLGHVHTVRRGCASNADRQRAPC